MNEKYIYAVQHPHGYFKIGRAKQPYDRKSQIQVGSPYKLKLKYVLKCLSIRGKPNAETEIHDRLEEYHHQGEWFEIDEDTVKEIFETIADEEDQEPYRLTDIEKREQLMPEWKRELGRRVKL